MTTQARGPIFCTVEGCESDRHEALGWCPMHYKRWQRNDNPTVNRRPWLRRVYPDAAYSTLERALDRGLTLAAAARLAGMGYDAARSHRKRNYRPVPGLRCDTCCGFLRDHSLFGSCYR